MSAWSAWRRRWARTRWCTRRSSSTTSPVVRGAHEGEGLGNRFLANIRETDAILHVVRVHDDAQVVHPEGRVDPLADVETIETELLFADLEQAERRLERVSKQAKSLDKIAVAEERWLERVVQALREGRGVRSVPEPEVPRRSRAPFRAHLQAGALRGQRGRGRAARAAAGVGRARARARRPRGGGERPAGLRAVGARRRRGVGHARGARSGRVGPRDRDPRGVRPARPDPVLHGRAGRGGEGDRDPPRNACRRAAGAVHSDMERGFVAAEVTPWMRWWRPAATRRLASGPCSGWRGAVPGPGRGCGDFRFTP